MKRKAKGKSQNKNKKKKKPNKFFVVTHIFKILTQHHHRSFAIIPLRMGQVSGHKCANFLLCAVLFKSGLKDIIEAKCKTLTGKKSFPIAATSNERHSALALALVISLRSASSFCYYFNQRLNDDDENE